MFGSFVVDEFRRRLNSNVQTRDMRELFQRIGVVYNSDIEKAKFFVDLWNETLDELDPESRKLVLYNIKLEIERRMEDRIEGHATFEKARFEIRNRYDFVAIEGNCKKCKICFSLGIDLRSYLNVANLFPTEPVTGDCVKCNTYDSVVFKMIENWD